MLLLTPAVSLQYIPKLFLFQRKSPCISYYYEIESRQSISAYSECFLVYDAVKSGLHERLIGYFLKLILMFWENFDKNPIVSQLL